MTAAYCIIPASALGLFFLVCLAIERRGRDNDTAGTDHKTRLRVEWWEAEVDSWLAQLTEIRNLVTLSEGGGRSGIAPTAASVACGHADDMRFTAATDGAVGCDASREPSAATTPSA